MKSTQCVIAFALLIGCGEAYVPKEPTAEQIELAKSLSQHSDALKAAFQEGEDYVQVAVVDRNTTFPDDEQEYSRVLVLQREELDLDDYGFSPPGKEESELDEDYLPGFFNGVMFWVDSSGQILFDDFDRPPGMEMVVEWCVPNIDGDKVSLHYGGNPCLVIDLTK